MSWKSHIRSIVLIVIVVVVFGWLYSDTIFRLVLKWKGSEDHSYGFMMPLICLYLIWERRHRLRQIPITPCWWGLAVLVPAVAFLVIARMGTIFFAASVSLLIAIFGLLIMNLGFNFAKCLAFPLAFLIFAIPFPTIIYDSLTLPLALASSNISTKLMRLLEISVNREGNIIDLGTIQLQVVEACSGLRYVLPLLAFGIFAAYFCQRRFWKRVVLVISTIPIGIIVNSWRIGITGILAKNWGAEVAQGFFHTFSGLVISVFAFGILYLENMILNRIGRTHQVCPKGGDTLPKVEAANPSSSPQAKSKIPPQYVASIAVLIIPVLLLSNVTAGLHTPLKKEFMNFPMKIGEYAGRRSTMDPAFKEAIGVDDYLLADYSKPPDPSIRVYIPYYGAQGIDVPGVEHTPSGCLPGSGWEITDEKIVKIQIPGAIRPLEVKRLITNKYGQVEIVFYWFNQRGRSTASKYRAKIYQLYDAITRHRSDGAMVRLRTNIYKYEEPAAAERRLTHFTQALLPILAQYLPD